MSPPEAFTEEQQLYLQGFAAGCAALQTSLPNFADTLAASGQPVPPKGPPDARSVHLAAQDRFLAAGKKLCPEEQAKRDKDPFQMWDEIVANGAAARFPKGTDVFLYKFHGLFHVAPAQNAFMCRLRFPGGLTNSHQFRGLADLVDRCAAGHIDVTTRANLQIREIGPEHAPEIITTLFDLGVISRGSGADNIRNVTGTPTAGIDPQELIDTQPLCKAMHHYILQHPEMYGLPRKFNIAFDGGGTISALADTNDIGFMAVKVEAGHGVPPGVYFRMELGGITGHKDFARDCGVLLRPDECVAVAAAVVRVFIEQGDRTDRKKARMKYVLDRLGLEEYLKQTEAMLGRKLLRFPIEKCVPRGPVLPAGHIGPHAQRQSGKFYVGVVLPVGRLTSEQMRGLAKIADVYGSGTIRLTVWQNLLLSDMEAKELPAVKEAIHALGLATDAHSVRAGLVACTGAAGCKYAAAHTKQQALSLANYLEGRIELDQSVNIHLTGCHHSCAQHYIGDIGLLATKVSVGEEMVEGYHVFVGGGYGDQREIGRQLLPSVAFTDLPPIVERLLSAWKEQRATPEQTFRDWSKAMPLEELKFVATGSVVAV